MDDDKNSPSWQANVKNLLEPILGNPRLTPIILFILAVVPLLTLALIVFLTLPSQMAQ